MSIRSFIAIDIPETIKDQIYKSIEPMFRLKAPVSWTRKPAYHLTLQFLGDISESQVASIASKISQGVKGISTFSIRLTEQGMFPNQRSPRVLWVGLEAGNQKLSDIQKKVERELQTIGFPSESRPYHPHLTLGRIKGKVHPLVIDEFLKIQIPEMQFDASEIMLMQSSLKPAGAVYTPLKIIRFE